MQIICPQSRNGGPNNHHDHFLFMCFVVRTQRKVVDANEVSLTETPVNAQPHLLYGRSISKAAKAIALFRWNRGLGVINVLRKNAIFVDNVRGYDEYTKVGGLGRALADFRKAELVGIKKQNFENYDLCTGWKGNVVVNLKISVVSDDITMTVTRAQSVIQKAEQFVIYYTYKDKGHTTMGTYRRLRTSN